MKTLKFWMATIAIIVLGVGLYSCQKEKEEQVTNLHEDLNVQYRTSKPCDDYCDQTYNGINNVPYTIYLQAVRKDPVKGCCVTFSYNGVGGWVQYPDGYEELVPFEGKKAFLINHKCAPWGCPDIQVPWWESTVINGRIEFCGVDFPNPQLTLHIMWGPNSDPCSSDPFSHPYILGCWGEHIGNPGENEPDRWRDNCQ